ncbi:peptidoglycan binding-like protein [Serratia phage vB_SmaM-Sureiya]|nr:peptidoglycan binding-like protein [Serratia phage vB_SmaM-Sureiya]
MNHNEIKAIAGVASIQTMIRGVGTIKKIQELSDVKIDGLVGPFTYNALNFIAGEIFGTKPYVPDGMYRPEDGILALQKWYEGVRTTMVPRRAMLQPQLECDGVWGDETYNTFKTLLHSYGHRLIDEQVGVSGKHSLTRRPTTGRPFISGKQTNEVHDREVIKAASRELVHLENLINDAGTLEILAKAMDWQNPVITPAQLLVGGFDAIAYRDSETKETLGVLIYRKPERGSRLYSFSIAGIYVLEKYRGNHIGSDLITKLITYANNGGTTVSFINNPLRRVSPNILHFLSNHKVTIE